MHVIKLFVLFFVIVPFFAIGQSISYPKDTIYIKYVDKIGNRKIPNWNYKGGYGTYFSIKDESGKHISLFHPKERTIDTLCNLHIDSYNTINLKEINRKLYTWNKKLYKGQRKPPANRNGAFITYLVEVISKDKFVIYPVIWRNEGIID